MLALVTGVTEDELSLRTTEQDVAIAIGDSAPGHYDRVRVGVTVAMRRRQPARSRSAGGTTARARPRQAVGVPAAGSARSR